MHNYWFSMTPNFVESNNVTFVVCPGFWFHFCSRRFTCFNYFTWMDFTLYVCSVTQKSDFYLSKTFTSLKLVVYNFVRCQFWLETFIIATFGSANFIWMRALNPIKLSSQSMLFFFCLPSLLTRVFSHFFFNTHLVFLKRPNCATERCRANLFFKRKPEFLQKV